MPSELKEELMTMEQAGKVIGVSHSTIRRYLKDGSLEYVKLGWRTNRITMSQVQKFLDSKVVNKAEVK